LRTACSNNLQISSASADGAEFVFTGFSSVPMVAMTRRGTSRRPSASGPVRVYLSKGVTQATSSPPPL
jgi:hypothetical protein